MLPLVDRLSGMRLPFLWRCARVGTAGGETDEFEVSPLKLTPWSWKISVKSLGTHIIFENVWMDLCWVPTKKIEKYLVF